MQTQENEVFDLSNSVANGKPVRDHGPYSILFGNESLEYRPAVIADPVPTGLQLLDAAGVRPLMEYQVFQVLANGMLERLRQDETTDLRSSGVEKFLIFRSDASYRMILDDREVEWGGKFISGLTLKKLAGVDPVAYGVWQEMRGGGEDRLIGDKDLVDLSAPGVERFFTGLKATTEG